MSRKGTVIWLSFVLVFSLIVIIVDIAPVVEAPTIWYVDDVPGSGSGNPPEDFTSIQDAINASIDGDTVFVYNGTYYENVIVNKTINFTGKDKDSTIINGSGVDNVVLIESDWVNITGFTITNSGGNGYDAGLLLDGVNYCWVFDNNVSYNRWGISLRSSSYNNVITNFITRNSRHSMFIEYSSNNEVISNNISYNDIDGIYFWSSHNNNITRNNISDNRHGILLHQFSRYNIIKDNNVYLNGMNGIFFYTGAENNIVMNNDCISNTRYGIEFYGLCDYNIIQNNSVFLNNMGGINIDASTYNKILSNNITNNTIGINIRESSNTIISTNNISLNNLRGIKLYQSSGNKIFHNNIVDNTVQANDDSDNGNQWDNGYPLGGNYWSDYGGVDNFKGPNQDIPGYDGIGDMPYMIDGNSHDNYPLIGPYKSLENYTILKKGWNLISIPLIQVEQNLTRILGSIEGWYDAVQWYDTTDINDPWKHHKVGKPFGNDLFELNETMGFWIYITKPGDTIFLYNGTIPTQNQTITLHPGWNMVGYPSLTNHNRAAGLNNLTFGQEVDSIWIYDAATQKWEEIGSSDYFEKGRGYWIHAKTTCVWEVPL